MANKFHPDKKGGDVEKMKKINEAYNILLEKNSLTKINNQNLTVDLEKPEHFQQTKQSVYSVIDSKFELKLRDFQSYIINLVIIPSSFTLFISILLALCTTDFKNKWKISAATWELFFISIAAISFVVTIKSIVYVIFSKNRFGFKEFIAWLKENKIS